MLWSDCSHNKHIKKKKRENKAPWVWRWLCTRAGGLYSQPHSYLLGSGGQLCARVVSNYWGLEAGSLITGVWRLALRWVLGSGGWLCAREVSIASHVHKYSFYG